MHSDAFLHYHGKQRCNAELCCPLFHKEIENWMEKYMIQSQKTGETLFIIPKIEHTRETLICEYLLKLKKSDSNAENYNLIKVENEYHLRIKNKDD